MERNHNPCAGPFGAAYSFWIEREWLARLIGRTVWGMDVAPMYRSMAAIAEVPDGGTVVDVPCGSGVALRALRPEQQISYLALDIDDPMLARTRARATAAGLEQVATMLGDMRALPLESDTADLACCYSGLHMIEDPQTAVAELARVTRPGGTVVGATFVAGGSRRQEKLFAVEASRGNLAPLFTRETLEGWLTDAGLTEASATGRGFAVFRAVKPGQPT